MADRRIDAVRDRLSGVPRKEVARKYDVDSSTVTAWMAIYRKHGFVGFRHSGPRKSPGRIAGVHARPQGNRHGVREGALRDRLAGMKRAEVAAKYGVKLRTLDSWVRKYRQYGESFFGGRLDAPPNVPAPSTPPPDLPELTAWEQSLGLPFKGLRQAKSRLERLQSHRQALADMARSLHRHYATAFPPARSRLRLHRCSDRSHSPLRWRLTGHDAAIELDVAEVQLLFSTLAPPVIRLILDFERRRIHLNHAMTTVMYEIGRLDAFIQRCENWRRLQKTCFGRK